MRYDNLRAFEKHLEGAKLLKFSPVYLVIGKEQYECQEAVDLLLRFLLPSSEKRELALSLFEGSEVGDEELKSALYSSSFFVKSRVICIQQVDKLKKSAQEILEKYFSSPTPLHYILLSTSSWSKNSSFYKAIEKEGIILEFSEAKPWEKEKHLCDWVIKQIASTHKSISLQASQTLVRRIGIDQTSLARELEKLLCYCADKKEITQQDVEAICHPQQVDSVWQLGESIFCHDTASALQIAHDLMREKQTFLPILRQVRTQFQTEYQICLLLAQGKQAHDITQEFPYMKGKILERHLKQAQQYGLEAFKNGLLLIDATELRMKNSLNDEKLLVDFLILKLTSKTDFYER